MRWAAGLEYDGGAFRGWQSQKCGGGAQDAMLRALSPLGGRGVAAAGRTDSGVHAALQIVHFDSDIARPPEVWSRAANDALPPPIRMLWAAEMPDNFHARHSAVRRRYHYVILNRPPSSAILRGRAMHCRTPLSLDALREGLSALPGERDFSAFRAAACQAKTPHRCLHFAEVEKRGDFFGAVILRRRFFASDDSQHCRRAVGNRQRPPSARLDGRVASKEKPRPVRRHRPGVRFVFYGRGLSSAFPPPRNFSFAAFSAFLMRNVICAVGAGVGRFPLSREWGVVYI